MNITVITHIAAEGPGTLGTFLESRGACLLPVPLYDGARLPESLDGVDAVISMGGPMNVYEEDAHPFLREEAAFLKEAVSRDLPVLGVCLGAQNEHSTDERVALADMEKAVARIETALANNEGMTAEQRFNSSFFGGGAVVPVIKVRDFNFSGKTDF